MSEERKAAGAGGRASQIIGQVGVYATYLAAALFLLVIAGDLDVLVGRAPLIGWLGPLVVIGPVVALQLSTLASYINYYGVWRVARRKDEYDVKQDLKSHAADLPQAAQALLAGRTGCLPAASVALLVCSLLLLGVTLLPPATPMVGALGVWNQGVDGVALNTKSAAQGVPGATPTATLAPIVAPSATTPPTVAPSPSPRLQPTATPAPVIAFTISPATATWNCTNQGTIPAAQTLTLDNSKSTVAVNWKASVDSTTTATPWATLSALSGTIPAHGKGSLTVTPTDSVCLVSSGTGSPSHVRITPQGAATQTFTYTTYFNGFR